MESFLTKQEAIYLRIAREGLENSSLVKIGSLDPGKPFGSILVVARHQENTRDALHAWAQRAEKEVAKAWLAINPRDSFHVTIGNSGPEENFEVDPSVYQKIQRLKILVWDMLKNRQNDFGEVAYPEDREGLRNSSIILGADSILAAGRPDLEMETSMIDLAQRLSDERMGTPWGTHTTLGRFRQAGELDYKILQALRKMAAKTCIPPTPITTLDVALQLNRPKNPEGDDYQVAPQERYLFENGVWCLAE